MTTLVARFAEKLISCSLCRGMESKEPIKIFASQKKDKVVAMATLVARFAEKLIRPTLCNGMESKEPIKIFTSPRNPKKCC